MKKHDNFKIDAISGINEKIIDEVTDKKIALSEKAATAPAPAPKSKKNFIIWGSIAASVVLIASVLLIILSVMNPAVPVYKGMTIKTNADMYMDSADVNYTYGITPLGAEGVAKPRAKKDPHKNETTEPEQNIEDMVTITVEADDEIKYYVRPGETFIIEIHIDNPKDYEIQSFTLNGQKYANYMFKEGSTMELLLLEVKAPDEPGYTEYTIDAIKYIDGTEIKDVDMSSADKSVKAGIAYPTAPSAQITSQDISATSLSLSINVSDPYSLIANDDLILYLSDGKGVVESKVLTAGSNDVTFENLTINTTYEYGVIALFDLVDGNNLRYEWLTVGSVKTSSAYGIKNAAPTQTSISFDIEKFTDASTISSISLYDAETDELVAEGDGTTREFTNLLSGHKYKLYVDFTYTTGGEEIADWASMTITTVAKTAPTVIFGNMNITENGITGDFEMQDKDSIGTLISVDIYKNTALVENNTAKEISFTGLDAYTPYMIAVTYTYDLNDGEGIRTKTDKYSFYTLPHLEFTSCRIINTSAVNEGDTIYMQIGLDNPSGATPTSVVVNGKKYNCAAGTSASKAYIEIVNNGQFEIGECTLSVEKINLTLDKNDYAITVTQNNSDTVSIRIKLDNLDIIKSFALVVKDGSNYVERDFIFPSDTAYLLYELDYEEFYDVESITLESSYHEAQQISNPTSLGGGRYLIPISPTNAGIVIHTVKIKYTSPDNTDSATKTVTALPACKLASDQIVEISTPEGLLNMNENKYYKLTRDIDLEGINWVGAEFNGVFDGGGHSILNMSRVETLGTGDETNIGLFSTATGIIKNLNLENVIFMINGNGTDVNVGALAGATNKIIINNCHVDANSIITATNGNSHVGGLIGWGYNESNIKNCTNGASVGGYHAGGIAGSTDSTTIIDCTNDGEISGVIAGGIAGDCNTYVETVKFGIIGCTNNGTVNSTVNSNETITDSVPRIGGIAGHGNAKDCVNNGTVNSRYDGDYRAYAAGIVGGGNAEGCTNNGKINGNGTNIAGIVTNGNAERCTNNGKLSTTYNAAGIVYGGNATDCINNGDIEARTVCGIAYGSSIGGTATNCINTGDLTLTGNDNSSSTMSNERSENCVNIGSYNPDTQCGARVNCYDFSFGYIELSKDILNQKEFYTDTLGWSEDIWNFDDLDWRSGKYPTLR